MLNIFVRTVAIYSAPAAYPGFLLLCLSAADILKLAAAIQELSRCSRRTRTAIWCSLVLTTLFSLNPELAGAEDVPPEALLGPLASAGPEQDPAGTAN